jgi:hypothetical protein
MMTAAELNERFAKIYDSLVETIKELEALREQASDDETWEEATEQSPLGDVLMDLEFEMEVQERHIAQWHARQ